MTHLTGAQKQHLRGLAHGRKPVVLIGQKQLTPQVIREIKQALDFHELIKVKCIDPKEKADKKEIADAVAQKTGSQLIGMIGHILIFYKQQQDPEKCKITLPSLAPAGRSKSQRPTGKDAPE